jgi:uncharacterized protein DUF3987/primase-like protein
MNAHTKTELPPDTEMLARFCAALFKHANPQGFVSLRAFPDEGKKDTPPIFVEPINIGNPQFLAVVSERARQAANWPKPAVFCPPLVTLQTAKNAKTENILEGVALSVDCDSSPNAARATLAELLGDPTVIVASGGEWANPETGEVEQKVHIHWRLKTPTATQADHQRLREARDLATKLVASDATAVPLVHPLRWPGSWHRKKDPPRLAEFAFESENEIDLGEALELLRDAAGASTFKDFNAAGTGADKLKAANVADVASALAVIPNDNLAWSDWNNIGMATWGATGGSEEGWKAFAEWSAKASKNDPEATRARWEHYKKSPPNRIGFGTLVYHARQHKPGWTPGRAAQPPADPVDLWAKFDPPTLPRGVLPEVIEAFAFDRGIAMGCDMGGLAVSALAVCAAAIPDSIKLQPKKHDTGWVESARLWVAPVGLPSTMKSPMMAAAVKPLRRIDFEMARENQEAMADYYKLPAEERKMTAPPKQTRLMLQDTTIEAAQEILKDSPDGVLSFQDELSGWFGAMDKYSGGRGAAKDRGFWLEAYNGGSHTINRIGRGSVVIENLSVSMLGGIQPESIRRLAEDGSDDGLLQRLIPIVLRPAVVGRDEKPSEVLLDYNKLISNLHQLTPPMTEGLLITVAPLKFDDGALAVREELERRHLELQQCEIINRKLGSHIGKYNGIFARLCVVWHCIEHAGGDLPVTITEATARRVARFLHGFLLPHALAFYAGVLGLSDDHDRLASVAGYILAHKLERITNRDVQRGDRTMRGLERREIEAVFDQLDALAWVNRIQGPQPSSPPHWIVNPAVHAKFAQRAGAEKERRERERKIIAGMMKGSP